MATGAGPFSWAIRFVVELLFIFTFSCILLRPLWMLAMTRPSLIIVFSRGIGNLLRLFGNMPIFIVYDIFHIPMTSNESYYWTYGYSVNGYIRTMQISAHVHNLALAINRSHAMFFPFHYNMVFAKKRNIYVLCLCLWLICICFGSSDYYFVRIKFGSPASQLSKYCMYASGLCYAALGCRMLWMRFKSSSVINGASTEKDSIKILIVCFSCLVMSTLNQLVFERVAAYAQANLSDTEHIVALWGSYISQWLIYCTEEICLALLVRDFRQYVKQQLRSVFCCCYRSSISSSSNNNNTISVMKVAKVTKVKALVNNAN